MDTLFVFQLLFISMLIISILMMFSYQGTIGRPFVWYTIGILVIVNIIVVINRSMYTNNIRDKKQWGKVEFNGLNSPNGMNSPNGKDDDYIAKLDAKYGENGVVLTASDKAAIATSCATSAALAKQYGVSAATISVIKNTGCSCNKCT